jgi:hypothetical protein
MAENRDGSLLSRFFFSTLYIFLDSYYNYKSVRIMYTFGVWRSLVARILGVPTGGFQRIFPVKLP